MRRNPKSGKIPMQLGWGLGCFPDTIVPSQVCFVSSPPLSEENKQRGGLSDGREREREIIEGGGWVVP